VAAHYLCELSEQALLQGDLERALLLLRQARTHDNELPRAGILAARITETTGDERGALTAYLSALEGAPGLALEIIPRALALASHLGDERIVESLTDRLQKTGRVSQRQLAWLLATALPTLGMQQLPDFSVDGDKSTEVPSQALGALLTRISDSGGRYQCDDCGLHSVGWYWRCPKCRSWDSLRPAVFKWAERAGDQAGAS
jgi:lipopolysaccharide biosynthesis regulator YciM